MKDDRSAMTDSNAARFVPTGANPGGLVSAAGAVVRTDKYRRIGLNPGPWVSAAGAVAATDQTRAAGLNPGRLDSSARTVVSPDESCAAGFNSSAPTSIRWHGCRRGQISRPRIHPLVRLSARMNPVGEDSSVRTVVLGTESSHPGLVRPYGCADGSNPRRQDLIQPRRFGPFPRLFRRAESWSPGAKSGTRYSVRWAGVRTVRTSHPWIR